MIAIVPHTSTGLQDQTRESVAREFPRARYHNVEGNPLNYWWLLRQYITKGEPFVVIEHDMVVPPGAARSFARCSKPWCSYRYESQRQIVEKALGLTRFIPSLLPETFLEFNATEWPSLDCVVTVELQAQRYTCHVHGSAQHLHYVPEPVQWSLDANGDVVLPAGWDPPTFATQEVSP